jgi:hypothetical protein
MRNRDPGLDLSTCVEPAAHSFLPLHSSGRRSPPKPRGRPPPARDCAGDLVRPRVALEAEILVLRQQIIVLRRGSPSRVPFRAIDVLMRRREFLCLAGGAVAAWPRVSRAQQTHVLCDGWLALGVDALTIRKNVW